MFGLTVYELQPSKVTSASQNQKIVKRDNSKTVVLIVLKLSQLSSGPKSTPKTNFRQNLRHEGEKFEKSGTICHGMTNRTSAAVLSLRSNYRTPGV